MKIVSIFLAVVAVLFPSVTYVNAADDEHTGTSKNHIEVVQSYKVEAVLCEDQQQPITQGTMIRICLTPDVFASGAGILIESIDEFTWIRRGTRVSTQQAVIRANTVSNNGLTTLSNTHGDGTEYRLESVLFASFYASGGSVTGTGRATLANAAGSSVPTEGGEDIKMQSTFSIEVKGLSTSKRQQVGLTSEAVNVEKLEVMVQKKGNKMVIDVPDL